MTQEQQREQAIENIAGLLRRNPFSIEFKVKKKPQGIKIIYEVTQEEMEVIVKESAKRRATL